MECIICGIEHTRNSLFCSSKCYAKHWYINNREYHAIKMQEWHKKTYKPHPKPVLVLTEEEIKERAILKKERAKKYAHEHREEISKRARERYQLEPDFRERHKASTNKWIAKNKNRVKELNKINGKKYRERNAEKLREKNRLYRIKNREIINAKARERYHRNKEKKYDN